jgi:hypothetical protein
MSNRPQKQPIIHLDVPLQLQLAKDLYELGPKEPGRLLDDVALLTDQLDIIVADRPAPDTGDAQSDKEVIERQRKANLAIRDLLTQDNYLATAITGFMTLRHAHNRKRQRQDLPLQAVGDLHHCVLYCESWVFTLGTAWPPSNVPHQKDDPWIAAVGVTYSRAMYRYPIVSNNMNKIIDKVRSYAK